MILSKTPVRIEIGGGGTDVEPYSSDYGGFVINVTINQYFRSILNKRDDQLINLFSNDTFTTYKFDIIKEPDQEINTDDLLKAIVYYLKPSIGADVYIHGEPLRKAGLGASASLSTSLIAGILKLNQQSIDLNDVAEKAFFIEQNILKNAGGRQDQYASVYGGFNELEFLGNSNVKVNKINLSKSFKQELEENLILFYTGEPHVSGNLVGLQIKSYLENKAESKKLLDKLKEIAFSMRDSLIKGDFELFGKLLTEDWKVKSKFNPLLTTDRMKGFNKLVISNGGIGGRVCGAGGGGCMIWLIAPEKKECIFSLLKKQSGKIIDFKFVDKGLEILNV